MPLPKRPQLRMDLLNKRHLRAPHTQHRIGDGTGTFRFTPGFGARADHSIRLLATDDGDGGGAAEVLTSELTFVVTVESPNEMPR